MRWMQSRFPIGDGDRVLQRTPVSFDASVWEFYAPLLAGATLVMAPAQRHFDHEELVRTIRDERITILQVVPSLLRLLLDTGSLQECASLKRVFSGGEPLTGELRDRFFRLLPQVQLCNLYGPTEACIDATYYVPTAGDSARNVPIGRPISNTQAYVLDDHMNVVPVGAEGELFLGGIGLARGYLNQPELTASRFIPSPWHREAGLRLYRTGDRCRYLADGNIEYLGRNDTQTKIRGIRVELEEVEHLLLEHPEIKACAAIIRRSAADEALLVAYAVATFPVSDQETFSSELRRFLKERLPEPCVPSAFVFLEHLPALPSGKIDRAALASLGSPPAYRTSNYVAPRTATESQLAEICRSLLHLERVGVNDNLFELGAHSLLATQIISRIRVQLAAELEIRHFFDSPTVAELASLIERFQRSDDGPVSLIRPVDREKYRRKLHTATTASAIGQV
jgi:acyl-coenzyme A synthetase/AMP-(fatty) acid ligase